MVNHNFYAVCCAVEVFEKMLVGKQLSDIFDDFGNFWQSLVSEDQIRWVSIACTIGNIMVTYVMKSII